MRPDTIAVVAKREYLLRIKSKGFWIGTLVLPLFAAAVTLLPAVFLAKSRSTHRVVVVDETGQVTPELTTLRPAPVRPGKKQGGGDFDRIASLDIQPAPPERDPQAQRAALDRRVLDKEIDSWVWIDQDALKGEPIEYHARNVSNMFTQEILRDRLSDAVRRVRLEQAGLDPDRIGEMTRSVSLETLRVSEEGSRAEEGEGGMIFAFVLFMTLYVTLMVWGQQVMNGVLEEKSSRVIEVVISSVKPIELLVGKLVGICLLGLTQFAIWLTTTGVLTAPGLLAATAMAPAGVNLPTLTPAMAVNLAILYVLGFFAFATLYATIGAAFNNLQEAQQVAGSAIFFFIAPVFFLWPVMNDPNSTLAVVLSLIPLFTPLLMTLRVALEMPPLWQLLLSYVLMLAFLSAMLWAAARIYRIGILMYGKKPTLQELWKWMRYA
ncbi:MAG TPA: ABC transporter permease [Thermoanaerobaculia bacterium]|nr:ABC transporter permease [Thermoanaerobaculia bacterium]